MEERRLKSVKKIEITILQQYAKLACEIKDEKLQQAKEWFCTNMPTELEEHDGCES